MWTLLDSKYNGGTIGECAKNRTFFGRSKWNNIFVDEFLQGRIIVYILFFWFLNVPVFHAVCSIEKLEPTMSHAICNIWELEPFIWHTRRRNFEIKASIWHAIWSILYLELSFSHAICSMFLQLKVSIWHAICKLLLVVGCSVGCGFLFVFLVLLPL